MRRCIDSLELTRGPSALKQKFHHLFLFLLFLAIIVASRVTIENFAYNGTGSPNYSIIYRDGERGL